MTTEDLEFLNKDGETIKSSLIYCKDHEWHSYYMTKPEGGGIKLCSTLFLQSMKHAKPLTMFYGGGARTSTQHVHV